MATFHTDRVEILAGIDYVHVLHPVITTEDSGRQLDLLEHYCGEYDTLGESPLYQRAEPEYGRRYELRTQLSDWEKHLRIYRIGAKDCSFADFRRGQHERHARLLHFYAEAGLSVAVEPYDYTMTAIALRAAQEGFIYTGQYQLSVDLGEGYVRFTLEDSMQEVLDLLRTHQAYTAADIA